MKRFLLVATVFAACSLTCFGKVELPSVIGSNMVIQQNTDAFLWGKAAPRAKVTVIPGWSGEKVSAKADKDGRWSVSVKTPAASMTPFEISISDGDEVVLRNVLVGDVWFCSGQSNMNMTVKGYLSQPVEGSADAILKAKSSRPIRILHVPSVASASPEDDIKAKWQLPEPDVVAKTSAVAYFFADYIQNALEIPVGIVHCAWGGSKIEAWLSRDLLESQFKGKFDLSHLTPGADFSGMKKQYLPCALYNGMIAPLGQLSVKGILWYQGCANRKDYADYPALQAALSEQLRAGFKSPDAPFYFAQIAPFAYGKPDDDLSGYFCEAQEKSLALIPNSGMVTTVDVGEEKVIHPAKKREVGDRFAYLALVKTYKVSSIEAAAPRVKSIEFADGKAIVSFSGAKLGLVPKFGNIPNFELAGSDKVFRPADAHLNKNGAVEVRCDSIPAPVAVRYCWRNWCVGTLKNAYGVPVGPFRSDSWPR